MKLTEQICPLSKETCRGELCPLYHNTPFEENRLQICVNPTGEYCYITKALEGIMALSISISEGLEDIDETLCDISYALRKEDEEYDS